MTATNAIHKEHVFDSRCVCHYAFPPEDILLYALVGGTRLVTNGSAKKKKKKRNENSGEFLSLVINLIPF